jgi:acyl-CoA dehydrogenase
MNCPRCCTVPRTAWTPSTPACASWCVRSAGPGCCGCACRPAYGGLRETLDVRSLAWAARRWPASSGLADFRPGDAGPGQRAGHPVRQPRAEDRAAARRGRGPHHHRLRAVRARCRLRRGGHEHQRHRLGGGWRLDGVKTWISNAGLADHYVVFARSGEAPGCTRHLGLHGPGRHAGAGRQRAHRRDRAAPAGHAAPERLPRRRRPLLGEPGQGFKIAMGTLDSFRTTVGAAALGFARRAMDEAVQRARSAACSAARWPTSSSRR